MTKYYPIERPKTRRPVAFITSANRDSITFTTDLDDGQYHGNRQAIMGLWRHVDHAVYSFVKPNDLIECCGLPRWQIVRTRDKINRLIFDGKITIYPLDIQRSSPEEVALFFDRCWEYGVNAGGPATMAMKLWQRSLYKETWIHEWSYNDKPRIGRMAFIGGRKEARNAPSRISGATYLDLPAAYLQAMKDSLPQWLNPESKVDWYDSGIALATVTIPSPDNTGLWWGPLPSRIGKARNADLTTFGWGQDRGFWTLDELRQAKANGVEVKLERVWKGYSEARIFQTWLDIAYDLRNLPGGAGKLAKQITNRLWSYFGMNPTNEKVVISYSSNNRQSRIIRPVNRGGKRDENTTFLSAMIASRVRVRAAQEMLSQPGCVYFDTDGGIVPSGTVVPGWNSKWEAEEVEIATSQAYRYRCSECGVSGGHPEWHTSVAGVQRGSKLAEDMFEWLFRNPDKVFDVTHQSLALPAGDIQTIRHSRPELEWNPLEGLGA
jgi:hypothetical protein